MLHRAKRVCKNINTKKHIRPTNFPVNISIICQLTRNKMTKVSKFSNILQLRSTDSCHYYSSAVLLLLSLCLCRIKESCGPISQIVSELPRTPITRQHHFGLFTPPPQVRKFDSNEYGKRKPLPLQII